MAISLRTLAMMPDKVVDARLVPSDLNVGRGSGPRSNLLAISL